MFILEKMTAQALLEYKKQVARLNGCEDFSAAFEVLPAIEQELVLAYKQQTDFLERINVQLVKGGHGQKLQLGSGRTAASTTDTRIQPRRPTTLGEIEGVDDYLCTQTDFDIAYDYNVIDNWGYLPDFQLRLSALAVKTVAQDRQRIGFNGTHRAKTSNSSIYPMLQDVNVGWLEKMRTYNSERHMDGLNIGPSHDAKNLDAAVQMALDGMIGEQFRDSDDLVVITSRGMVSDKYTGLINQNHSPTEQAAANILFQKKELGTLPVDTPAFFPANTILITSYDNLSIYQQRGTLRRHIRDEPEWNRTTDYQSVNECYVVEDYAKAVLIENIVLEV